MSHLEFFQSADEEHEAFLRAIGELTLAWSDLEVVLYKLLKHYAGVSDAVGRAIFSGTRASTMINFLKAIADNTNMEETRKSDLDDIFSHIKAINSMRDFVVHHVDGTRQEFELENPRERVLTDSRRVSRTKNTRRVDVGSHSLIAMRDDIIECCWRLQSHWDHTNEPFKPGAGVHGLRNAWKFKSPQPKRTKVKGL
jgi:hypothetical protein